MSGSGEVIWTYDPWRQMFRFTHTAGDGTVLADYETTREGLEALQALYQEALVQSAQLDKAFEQLKARYPLEAVGPALWQAPPTDKLLESGEEPV